MATVNKNFKVKNGLDVSGNTTVEGTVTATAFIGDGSGLSNITGGGGAPTVVNAGYRFQAVQANTFGVLAATPLTITVTPSSTSSPVFVTFNFQAVALDGQGDAGLQMQLYQGGNAVPNSVLECFLQDNGSLAYAQFPVTYTFAFVPGVATPTALTLYAKNTGGNRVIIGTPLEARFMANAIVW